MSFAKEGGKEGWRERRDGGREEGRKEEREGKREGERDGKKGRRDYKTPKLYHSQFKATIKSTKNTARVVYIITVQYFRSIANVIHKRVQI